MSNILTLGITTIGDLLLKNKISETSDSDTSQDISLHIPEYQRPYKWSVKNVNQLLDDIEEARTSNKEVYRVGTLILHHDEHGYDNIVDGQQRTITFSLLLTALGQEGVSFLDEQLYNNQYNMHNVINNYRALRRRVGNMEKNARDELTKYIKENCEMIVVITNNISEAFQFFDSQNARGKALYPHDLLKAYHLREMADMDEDATAKVVRSWEDLDQKKLAALFNEYLYRLREWIKGNRPDALTEQNIDLFKGVTAKDAYPFAKYYKGAFSYADETNASHLPFVTGIQSLPEFQLASPIIAGKPFFDYTKHYFGILADIQNNDKYEGYFINDNEIVKTLDLKKYKNGVGNGITRLMFDTSILLYVDRFCPEIPSKSDTEYLDRFVQLAFVWAYSMRAQYRNVGWAVAENYIMGTTARDGIVNGFNIYKVISEADSPSLLMGSLEDMLEPLDDTKILADKARREMDDVVDKIPQSYLYYFRKYKYWEDK